MSKKLTFSKRMKKFLSIFLVGLIAITLTGCDSTNRKSSGSLNMNSEYASASNLSVTVGELYDSLRFGATNYIVDSVYKFLYEEEMSKITANPAEYKEKLNEIILKKIYETSDEDEIKAKTASAIQKANETFVDTMFKAGYKISTSDIENRDFSSIYEYFYLDVAKYVAAREKLAKEFTTNEDGTINFGEINDDSYFTTKDVVDWYKKNYVNKGTVEALLIRFVSSAEAANVLKAFGIKTYDGNWYQIKLDAEKCTTKAKYEEYYDNYTVNPTGANGDASIATVGNGRATILKIFAEIYNYIYTYRDAIDYDTAFNLNTFSASYTGADYLKYYNYVQELIKKDHEVRLNDENNTEYETLVAVLKAYDAKLKEENSEFETIVMSNEKLNKYDSSLATYVYSTLATEAEEEGGSFTQYSTSAKSYGSNYYLVFKISQEKDAELYTENDPDDTNEDGDTEIQFTNEELKNKILNELFENKLSDDYINEIFDERVENAKLYIYDSMMEIQFMYSSTDSKLVTKYEKTKKSNNKEIAAVKYQGKWKGITVEDYYNYAEPIYGPQQAMILLFNKYIKTTDYYKDLEKNYNTYVSSIENMLYYFSNDYYASYGYPSSMGKYNFMMMYFRTANIKEAVQNFMMISDAQSAYYLDFDAKGFSGDSFFKKLQSFTEATYDDFYSLTATGLEVYTDRDEDGEADKLDATNDADLLSLANELLENAMDYIKTSHKDYATAMSDLINAYNSSSRIESENETSPEYKWAKYRKAGLYLKTNDLGAITNSTKDVNEAIQARIAALYEQEGIINSEYGFTSSILDDETIQTETGYTLLLLTAGENPSSAKYENEDNPDLYSKVTVILNDKKVVIDFGTDGFTSNKVTVNQIKAYVADYVLFNDVYCLPTSTTTALDTFVLPLISRYTSSASQYTMIQKQLGTITYANSDAIVTGNEAFKTDYSRNGYLAGYIQTLQNAADDYDTTTYPNWWTSMYEGGNN